jgi:putative mRNA 3-end processing factor
MIRLEKAGYQGIYLPDFKISLDGNHPDARYTLVSHAHADHLPRGKDCKAIATAPTAALMRLRGFGGSVEIMEFLKPRNFDSFTITLYPAGHILGSAMIFLESDAGSLLYTGDYRTPPSPASEGFSMPDHADIFITEATFGLPVYRWKSHDELADEIRAFALNTLEDGYIPIFLGYNLGKAQEIMHLLAPLNHPVQIHGAGYKLCSVYDDFGIDLGNYTAYDRQTCEGNILIAPSSALANGFASNVKKKRIAYCSGWAAMESRRAQLTVHKLIPISDHLDFFELLDVCKKLNPQKIYITHTPNPDVVQHYLSEMGFHSESLDFELNEAD